MTDTGELPAEHGEPMHEYDFVNPEPHVVVVGDAILDVWQMAEDVRYGVSGEPIASGVTRSSSVGGAALVASIAARLGATVEFVSVVGNDQAGIGIINMLSKGGVNTSRVVMTANGTTTKTRLCHKRKVLSRVDEDVVTDVPAKELAAIVSSALTDDCVVVISDYNKGVISKAVCDAGSAARLVIVDPHIKSDWHKYPDGCLYTPNIAEAATYVGKADPLTMARQIAVAKSGVGIVTCGDQGVAGADVFSDRLFNVKASAVSDRPLPNRPSTIGAGDVFSAALAVAIGSNLEAPVAARIANRVAAKWVHGCAVGQVDVADVVVFTNGVFDLFHAGHMSLLEAAASLGTRLIVGINSDESVARLKGPGRPIIRQEERAYILSQLAVVDEVIIFDEDTPCELLQELDPDILVKGPGPSPVGSDIVLAAGGAVVQVSSDADISTTQLVDRIRSMSTQ